VLTLSPGAHGVHQRAPKSLPPVARQDIDLVYMSAAVKHRRQGEADLFPVDVGHPQATFGQRTGELFGVFTHQRVLGFGAAIGGEQRGGGPFDRRQQTEVGWCRQANGVPGW